MVPNGYRLLGSEATSKNTTIDNTTKSQDIVFLVELLKPNLCGVKTSTPATPNLHSTDEITYTITINNTGNEEALNTIIQDKVPAHTELVSIGGGGVMDANGVITWNIPTIAADTGSVSVSFTVKTVAIPDSGQWNVVNDQATFNGVAMNTTTNELTQGLLTFEKLSSIANLKELLPGSKIDYTIKISYVGLM